MKTVPPGLVILLAIVIVLPGLTFIGLNLILPGDASAPVIVFQDLRAGGLLVQPLSPDPQGLQSGDIVTAIQGRPVDQFLNLFLSTEQPTGQVSHIEYTVIRGGQTLTLDVPLKAFPLAQLLKQTWSIYFFLIYLELVSILVFILRPRMASAQLFLVASSAVFSTNLVYYQGAKVDNLLYRWPLILFVLCAVGVYGFMLAALVHLALMFPKRHPLLVRHPRSVVWIYLGVWLPMLLYLAARWTTVLSPAGHWALMAQGCAIMAAVYFPLLLLSAFTSYRTSNAQEKRQARWILWGLMIALIPFLALNIVPSILGMDFHLANPLMGLIWCMLPTSYAIAILRERLFDIDVIIHRTLIYTALTVTLGAIYLASVLLLQEGFQVFTRQHQSSLATVLSTLVIAALFVPLRKRIQNDIDRRFYRRKYDAEKILEKFSLTVRNEVELDMLTGRLLEAVAETMEPQSFSLWICKD